MKVNVSIRIKKTLKQLAITATILLIGKICIGQTNETFPDKIKNKESFIYLSDTVIRKEIALFSIKGSSETMTDSYIKPELIEIPLIRCTDSSAYFNKGNIYSSEIIVGIYSEKGVSKSRIKEVKFIHSKYLLILPDSAFKDLYNPIFCLKNTDNKKIISTNCKVFQSEDKRRVYIYMLNGEGTSRYEVTWVIKNSTYYIRIMDNNF